MKIIDYCVSNKGIKPEYNQDNIYVNGLYLSKENDDLKINKTNKELVYAIFDGIGGLDSGEYASYIATINISKGINYINEKLLEISSNELINLGTTCTIVRIKNNKLFLEQVGDSPLYIYRNNKLIKYIETNSTSNLLDNYLGKEENINILKNSFKLKNNDIIVLCSDGLSNMIDDNKIEQIIKSSNDIKYITNKLLNEALIHGGNDNISIITLKVKKLLGIY